jgi:glycosyltransferase involved in cell wall biosynthesis
VRVLLVAHGYPPEASGGTELHARATARALAARGHDVSVLAASRHRPSGETEERNDEGVAVRLLGVRLEADFAMRLRDKHVRAEFERLLDERAPHVVHVQHLLFLSADLVEVAKKRGIPVVVSLHDFWFQCPLIHPAGDTRHLPGALWGLSCFRHFEQPSLLDLASLARRGELHGLIGRHLERARFLRRQLALADLVIAPSRFLRDRFVGFGVAPGKLVVLPHAAETQPLDGRIAERPVRFGFVGAVRPEKGVHVLCEAFSRVANGSTLAIHGPCEDEAYLAELAHLDPRIHYEGGFDHRYVRDVFERFDVLVAPSLVAESFSLVALEAQAFGRPVIASRIGALPELVEDGKNGLLVPAGDVAALRAALRSLARPHEAERMARATRVPLAPGAHADRLEELYTAVTA